MARRPKTTTQTQKLTTQTKVSEISALVDQIGKRSMMDLGPEHAAQLALAASKLHQLSFNMASTVPNVGECRRAAPFANLQLIMKDDGLYWCCFHDPEHCVKVA